MTQLAPILYPKLWERSTRYLQDSWSQEEAYKQELLVLESRWNQLAGGTYSEPFQTDKVPSQVKPEALASVLQWQFQAQGLYICGPCRMGKSRTAFVLVRHCLEWGLTVEAVNGIDFSAKCAKCLVESYEAKTKELIDWLLKPDVFLLDDFGVRWSDKTLEGVYLLLEKRGARKKPVIITSQYDREMIKTKCGDDRKDMAERIIGRRDDFCRVVVFG